MAAVITDSPEALGQDRGVSKPRSKLDVVLMLDSSGSMLKTDPNQLRYEGARLLVSFLSEGDRLGIVQFAGDAKVVQELEPFSPAKSEAVMQRIRSIPTEGAFTDITEGIKVSSALFDKSPVADAQRVIVVLSDGKIEPDPAVGPAFARTLQLVQDMLPELKSREMRVFTLALSEQADRALLGEVSAATDGLTWYTKTAEDMHKTFADLFLALKRPQVVPQTGRGFSIDADVDEATFYINHAADGVLSLVSPKEEVMTADKHPDFVTWFSGQNFDVITVTEPDLGEWRVAGSVAEDGFATVLTNLKLLTDWPLVIRAGDEPLVQARLYEDSKPVALPEMSGVVKFGFQIVPTDKVSKPVVQEALVDEGTRGDVVAQDGVFSSRVAALETGSYKLTVVAKGPTFQRTQQIPFTVRPRLITLSVRSPSGAFSKELERSAEQPGSGNSTAIQTRSGGVETEFMVGVSKEAAALKSFQVSLLALSEDRRIIDLPLKKISPTGRDYTTTADGLGAKGQYRIKAVLTGSDKKGQRVEAESPVVTFDFAGGGQSIPTKAAVEHDHDGESKSTNQAKFPLIPLVVVSLVNLTGFLVARAIFKKRKRSAASVGQRYLPPAQLLESIEALEGRASSTTVAAEDPLFELVEAIGREEPISVEREPESQDNAQTLQEPT